LGGDRNIIDNFPMDEHGHGTHVASVIASVAPNSKLMILRTHNRLGQSDVLSIANAIVYAVLNGAKIINLSSGEKVHSPLLHTAIKFAFSMGCVIVASAGNEGRVVQHFPSDYSQVISVGGINQNGNRIFN
jgi:subtilisin family serine protease